VRRVVYDYVLATLDRLKLQLERYVAEHLVYPESSHRVLTDPAASIREIRRLKIAPRFPADYPPVDVTVVMRVVMTAHTRDRGADIGIRTTAVDVECAPLAWWRVLGTTSNHTPPVSWHGGATCNQTGRRKGKRRATRTPSSDGCSAGEPLHRVRPARTL
jgi:DNA-binding transcriptional LysR family regulator